MINSIKKFTFIIVFLSLTALISLSVFMPIKVNLAYADTGVQEITVFSWEDYISEDDGEGAMPVLETFETETGIKVNYYPFATCEAMYNELKKDPNAVDIICPSEYMILKMKEEGLIKEFTMPDNYSRYASPYIKETFESIGLSNGEKTYAAGYMWGTMGLIYNMDKYSSEDFSSWTSLFDTKFKDKITIKDSVRDTYIMTLGIVYKDELLLAKDEYEQSGNLQAYKTTLAEIFNRTDKKTIDDVQKTLVELKQNLYGFEVDGGKNDILTGKIDVNFAWSGDAAYAIYESDEIDGSVPLGYVVPEEGSNLWFDGWVLVDHKNSSNEFKIREDNALKFIDFMSRPDVAVANMDYIGYTSCIADQEVFDYVYDCYTAESCVITEDEYLELSQEEQSEYGLYQGEYYLALYAEDDQNVYGILERDTNGVYLKTFGLENGQMVNEGREEVYKNDLKYFFDPTATNDEYVIYSSETGRQLYAQYADEETINRCVIMDNFSDKVLQDINVMWSNVKLIALSDVALITISLAIVITITGMVLFKFRSKIFGKNIVKKANKQRRKNCKVIKIENVL